jgi:hypothetical protein
MTIGHGGGESLERAYQNTGGEAEIHPGSRGRVGGDSADRCPLVAGRGRGVTDVAALSRHLIVSEGRASRLQNGARQWRGVIIRQCSRQPAGQGRKFAWGLGAAVVAPIVRVAPEAAEGARAASPTVRAAVEKRRGQGGRPHG